MKKLLFVLSVICITATSVSAQKSGSSKPAISIGVDAGIPVGGVSGDVYSFIIGGSLQGDFKVAPELALTLSGGYQSWQVKKSAGGGSVSLIPVLGGIKYYFTPVVYGSGQLGVTFSTKSGGGSSFTYAPGVGFKVADNFDILAKYTGLSNNGINIGNVGVRLAYSF